MFARDQTALASSYSGNKTLCAKAQPARAMGTFMLMSLALLPVVFPSPIIHLAKISLFCMAEF